MPTKGDHSDIDAKEFDKANDTSSHVIRQVVNTLPDQPNLEDKTKGKGQIINPFLSAFKHSFQDKLNPYNRLVVIDRSTCGLLTDSKLS